VSREFRNLDTPARRAKEFSPGAEALGGCVGEELSAVGAAQTSKPLVDVLGKMRELKKSGA